MASYLFIPSWDARHSVTPVIASGWTLCYEMFFYVAFTICLGLRRYPTAVITPVFMGFAAIGLLRTDEQGPVATLLDPMLLEFVAGMWIGTLSRGAVSPLPSRVLTALVVLACAALVLGSWGMDVKLESGEALGQGVPSVVLMACFVELEKRIAFPRLRLPFLLGDASYFIYFIHVLAMPVLMRPLHFLRGSLEGEWLGFCLLLPGGLIVGLIVYAAVEKPFIRRTLILFEGLERDLRVPAVTM